MSEQNASEKLSFQKLIKGLTGKSPEVPVQNREPNPEYYIVMKTDRVGLGSQFCIFVTPLNTLVSVAAGDNGYGVYLRDELLPPGVFRPLGDEPVCIKTDPVSLDGFGVLRLTFMKSTGETVAEELHYSVLQAPDMVPTAIFADRDVCLDYHQYATVKVALIPRECNGMQIEFQVTDQSVVDVKAIGNDLKLRGIRTGDTTLRIWPKGFPEIESLCHVRVRENCFATIEATFDDEGNPKEMWVNMESGEKMDYNFAVLIEFTSGRKSDYVLVHKTYKSRWYRSGTRVPIPEVMKKLEQLCERRYVHNISLSLTLLDYDKERFTVWPETPVFEDAWWNDN